MYQMVCDINKIKKDEIDDKYQSWTKTVPIYSDVCMMGKGRMLYNSKNDTLILPVYCKPNADLSTHYSMNIEISFEEEVAIYNQIVIPESNELVQGHFVETEDHIKMYFRDRMKRNIWYVISHDNGISWTSPKKTNLANNNCGICPFKLTINDKIVTFMVFNNTLHSRHPLSMAYSLDGVNFDNIKDIEVKTETDKKIRREYSYPNVVVSGDTICMAYIYNRWGIKYIEVSKENLIKWLDIKI